MIELNHANCIVEFCYSHGTAICTLRCMEQKRHFKTDVLHEHVVGHQLLFNTDHVDLTLLPKGKISRILSKVTLLAPES